MDNYNNMSNDYYGGSYGAVEEEAPNIVQQLAYSFVPPKYHCLAKVKTGSMIAFVTLLVLIFALVSLGKTMVSYSGMRDNLAEFLDEFPDFELKDGTFSIEEPYLFDEQDLIFCLTDEVEEFSYDVVMYLVREKGYNNVLLVARKGIYMYTPKRDYSELMFKDLADLVDLASFTFNKDWIKNKMLPLIRGGIVIVYILGFVCGTLWYFACAAVYLLIAMLVALSMSKQIPAGKLFRAAVYSKVFMYVISKVWDLCSLKTIVPIPSWARIILTLVFLCFVVYCLGKPEQPTDVAESKDYSRYIY